MKDVVIDIETTGLNFFDVRDKEKELVSGLPEYVSEDFILSIGIWCEDYKEVFVGSDEKGFGLPDGVSVGELDSEVQGALYHNEQEVVRNFLTWFNGVSKEHNVRLAGYNIKNFDVPFIFYKAVKHDIGLGCFAEIIRGYQNYNNFRVADSYMALNFRIFKNNFGLAKVLKSWGMEGKYEGYHGGQARGLSKEELCRYNLKDVEIEWALHQRLVGLGILPNSVGGYDG